MTALAIVLSGLLAGLLSQPDGFDLFGDTSVGGVVFSSGAGGVAIAVILASALAMVVRRRRILAGLAIAAAVVAGLTARLMPSDLVEVLAGGVLLGCTAIQATGARTRQALLIASFLLGLLSVGAVEALQYPGVPRRYADYLTESDMGTPVIVPVLCGSVVLAVAWAARFEHHHEHPGTERGIRKVGAILLISVGGLLLDIAFGHSVFQSEYGHTGRWYFGMLVVPVLLAAAALLPGRGGIMVLAGTAVLITSTTTVGVGVGIDVSDGVWVLGTIAVTAVALVLGAALGVRWGHPFVGFAILAAVCASALFEYPPWDNVHLVASLLIFPAAAAFLYVACTAATPSTPTASTLGLAVPVAITVPMIVTYGWTAYTPLTSIDTSMFSPSTDLWLSTGAAVATVVLAGVGTRFLGRRPLPN